MVYRPTLSRGGEPNLNHWDSNCAVKSKWKILGAANSLHAMKHWNTCTSWLYCTSLWFQRDHWSWTLFYFFYVPIRAILEILWFNCKHDHAKCTDLISLDCFCRLFISTHFSPLLNHLSCYPLHTLSPWFFAIRLPLSLRCRLLFGWFGPRGIEGIH